MEKEKLIYHFQGIMSVLYPGYEQNSDLQKTPQRAAKALMEQTSGNLEDPNTICDDAIFKSTHNQQVYAFIQIIISNISVNSLCEHHLLPFFGICHIGYVPDQQILGLSKFSRVVNVFSRRLQIQERLTEEITTFLQRKLKAKGVIVYIESEHLCMKQRGVREKDAQMTTLYATGFQIIIGIYKDDILLQNQFLSMKK